MKLCFTWLNWFLEFIWNKLVVLQYPVKYRLDTTGVNRVVTQWIKVGEENKRYIFVSQQISYLRKGTWLGKKARLYRIEVIEEMGHNHPSKVYMIPELCSSIFRHTHVPHGCAINFVIDKLTTA